ncbi:ferrous iron transport protein B [Alistipes timonensis JC136]|uniref:Ferrous iron transport protein B n=1 Tax=Alistipes timonensis JC136 TaxID=1033731 RepID=A0A1H3XYY9_9BACT|nr:ferrous iron transport protein B [Alistipes timonensis]SEA04677.1 ferrous iron transport protein B [Alistipes timonensis JC136]
MRLSELKTGESGTIVKVMGHGGFRRRIMEMGFVRGQRVEVLLNAPLKDPIEYKIMGYDISLRRSEADMVEVLTDSEAHEYLAGGGDQRRHRHDHHHEPVGKPEQDEELTATEPDAGCCTSIDEVVTRRTRTITVALVGNPNSGKTSLFNAISGGHEHVGNYSGVTVGAKIGNRIYRGYRFEVTDLPGTYALSAYTPEERYVRHHLATHTPDVVINSVVASNLERNLYLTTELIDINPRMVVALNMFDELHASGATLDYENLGRMLGVPMVPVEARNNRGIDTLLDTVIDVYENRDERVRHIHINMGPVIEEGLRRLNGDMSEHRGELPKAFPPRYYAMKMLEGDAEAEKSLRECSRYPEWAEIRDREARRITEALGEDVETAFANQKYGFIQGALKETFTPGRREEVTTTAVIDTFVTHKLWGFPIFFALMWFMFWCTFSLGAYPQEWIDALVGWIGSGMDALLPAGPLRDLLVDGIIGGVGAVIVFLPNIMILYLFISFMEDSGYLARAAFIMDRVMHRIGLHGKSFIPLIMGFGCNVPAIMASRTIESRSSRLITILITPFMSCSARIPIYLLLAGTFFAANAGSVMLGLYVLGIVLAVVTARLMRRFLFPVDETPFVMELPPYRLPTWKTTLTHMWDKCAQYLKKMGGMILIASVVVWFLSYYPRTEESAGTEAHYENSYLGRLGKGCEPVFSPLGFNWKASVALLSGLPAKEIVVSTLGVLYSEGAATTPAGTEIIGGADGPTEIVIAESVTEKFAEPTGEEETASLSQRLLASGDFSTASALAFLVFILLYVPCIATVVAIGAEAGWKWAAASVIYNTALAWFMAWIVYRIALIF